MWIQNKGRDIEVIKMESFLYGLVIAWGLGILFGIFILKTPAKGAPEGVEPPASYEVCGTTGC